MTNKYKYTDLRINNLIYKEDLFNTTKSEAKISINLSTSIRSSNANKENYLIMFDFHIKDEEDEEALNIKLSMLHRISVYLDEGQEFEDFFKKYCFPDLLKRSRNKIEEVTGTLRNKPIKLSPFEEECVEE